MLTTPRILDEIRRHAEQAYPEECCGFLLGRTTPDGNEVLGIHRSENRQDDERERRYQMSPEDYLRAERRARKEDFDVVGFYHSHPDHPARPSPTDLREATFPGFTYVIVSVHDGTAGELSAWALSRDRSRFDLEGVATIEWQIASNQQ